MVREADGSTPMGSLEVPTAHTIRTTVGACNEARRRLVKAEKACDDLTLDYAN